MNFPAAESDRASVVLIVSMRLQQIKVTLNDDDMDTFVFAIGTKKAMARLQKEMQDLVNNVLRFTTA